MDHSNIRRFTFDCDTERLSCFEISLNSRKANATVVLLHGAGAASKERTGDMASDIVRQGYRVLAFDFAGQGESSGELLRQSLQRRFIQACGFIERHVPASDKLGLIGFSMSGQTIGDLLNYFGERVSAVGLCAPALYSRQAWAVPFDSGFTGIIRGHESWRDSSAYDALSRFRSRAVLAVPAYDNVIPEGVTKLVVEALNKRATFTHMVFDDAHHKLGLWFKDNEQARHQFIAELTSGLR